MIIFLDDDPDLGELIRKKFSAFGDEIRIYTTSKKLIESGDLKKASILCFDINLYLENGISFINNIRPMYPDISYICFSNYSELLEDQLQEAGVHSYVCKDDGIEELKNTLDIIFEERSIFKKSDAS